MALYTLALAVTRFYSIKQATEVVRCNNDPVFAKSKSNYQRVRFGASQAGILWSLCSIKLIGLFGLLMSGCRHTTTDTRRGNSFCLGLN